MADRIVGDRPDGFISVPGGRVAYWVAEAEGDDGRLPLLVLHGGPGLTHNYLEALADLSDERHVVFFDQLGCGDSEVPQDAALWTMERAVEEVEAVRRFFSPPGFHLFGNSYGGWLALSYVLHYGGRGVQSLILSSCPPDTVRFVEYCNQLRAELPEPARRALERHEAGGWFDCPEYQAAVWEFYRRHLCRVEPWPLGLEVSFAKMGRQIYESMWGPSEFGPLTGVLDGWSEAHRLGAVGVKTLVTAGRHDEASPDQCREMSEKIPGARFELFEESSHMAFYEERERYIGRVREFLAECEEDP